jgi:hypothetical protein
MSGWLAANCFLIGIGLIAAAIAGSFLYVIPMAGMPDIWERAAVGTAMVASLVLTGLIGRRILRRIENRR